MYVSVKLLCCEVSFDNSDHFDEQAWVKVALKGSDPLLRSWLHLL